MLTGFFATDRLGGSLARPAAEQGSAGVGTLANSPPRLPFSPTPLLRRLALACLITIAVGCGSGVKSKQDGDALAMKNKPVAPKNQPLKNGQINPNRKGPFKRVFEIVDKQQAMKDNPNYVEAVNTIDAGNYFTAVAQGAFAAASSVQTSSLQYYVRLYNAEHGKNPTLADIKKYLKDNGIELVGLYPYQIYAYDESTATISILEDTVERAKHDGVEVEDE